MTTLEERLERMRTGAARSSTAASSSVSSTGSSASTGTGTGVSTISDRLERMRRDGTALAAKTTTQATAQQTQTGQEPQLNTDRVQAIRAALPSGVDAMRTLGTQKTTETRRANATQQLEDEELEERKQQLLEQVVKYQNMEKAIGMGAMVDPTLTVEQAHQKALDYESQVKELETEQERRKTGEYLRNQPDYEQYAKAGAEMENPSFQDVEKGFRVLGKNLGGEQPKNIVTYSRENAELIGAAELNESSPVGRSLYRYMTEDEVNDYNYLLAKEGEKAAQGYLDTLEETLNYRAGTEYAQGVRDSKNPLLYAALSLGSGVESAGTGIRQAANAVLGDGKAVPTSMGEFAGRDVQSGLVDENGKKGLGYYAFAAGNTVGNMLPSIAVGILNPTAGLAAMGAGAGGNAYGEAIREGYSREQAVTYGTLVGASEALLEKLLGGLTAFRTGTGLAERLLAKVAKLDNVFARVALSGLVSVGSEINEEELQNFLEPAFRTWIFGEEYEAPTADELLETAIVTALSTVAMEGPSTVSNEVSRSADIRSNKRTDTAIDNAYKAMEENGMFSQPASEARAEASAQLGERRVRDAINYLDANGIEPAGVTEAAGNTETPATAENAAVGAAEAGTGQNKSAPEAESAREYHGDILDTVRANLSIVQKMQPVAQLTGTEFQKNSKDTRPLSKKIVEFFNGLGNKVTRSDIGDITLNSAGVRDSIGHGVGKLKAATFASLPSVLKDGQIIAENGPHEGHEYNSIIISAPVTVNGTTCYVGALVIQDEKTQRYKLHEVLTTSENGVPLFKTESGKNAGPLRSSTPLEVSEDTSKQSVPQQTAESNTKKMDMTDWLIEDGRRARAAREGSMSNEQQAATVRDDLSGGGEERISGEGAGGEAVRFPSRTEAARQTAEQSRTAVERQNRARDLRLTKTSAEALGIVGGSANNSLTVLPEGFDQQLDTLRQQIRTDTGRDATFVLGGIRVNTADGGTQTVRGVYASDGLIIQADNLRVSAEQIWKHEDFHDRVANTPGLLKQAVKHVLEVFDRDQFKAAVDNYMRVYGPLYGLTEDVTQEQYQEIYNKVLEEVLADAYAGVNAFGANATRYTETVRETVGPREPVNMVDLLREDRGQRYSVENTEADARTEEERRRDELTDKAFNFRRVTPVQETEEAAGTSSLAEPSRRQPGAGQLDSAQENVPATGKKATATSEKTAVSKATIAKKDFRQNTLNLFSIPAGQRAEVGTILDKAADRIVRDGALTQAERDALFDKLYESGAMEVPADEYFQMGREAVKGGRVYVDEGVKGEFFDDWNEFRKKAFANGVYLTDNPNDNHIDTWNMELAETLPGLFDATELSEREILERIVQVAEEGKAEKMSLAEYTARLAGYEGVSESEILDGMERQLDYQLRSFAEKAGLEIKLKDRQAAREATDRNRRQESAKRQSETRALRELQQKTLKQLQWLSKNRNKAPAELRTQFDEVLGDLDVYAASAADEMHWDKRFGATWRDLADMYETAKKSDPNFLPSKELDRIVARLDNDKIGDLDVGALQDLYKAAVGLRTEYYNRKNMVNDAEHRAFAEVYDDVTREVKNASGKWTGKAFQKLGDWMLTPMNRLKQMAGWTDGAWSSMAGQLEEGERAVRDYQVRGKRELESFLRENEDFIKTADGQGKDAVWYEYDVPELLELGHGDKPIFGDTVKIYMTPAQKVQLYLESKNYDNLRHIAGGRTFVNKEVYSQGNRAEALAQGTTVRLAPETVKKMVADLTPQEQALADALSKYYNGFAKDEINRVSNILYGYDKAMSDNYAPIFTDANYNKTEAGIYDVTAEGVGHLKGRIAYAKNPSWNLSALDAFERHVDQTAQFVGMSIPAHNMNTLMNWTDRSGSMRKTLAGKWGGEATKYVDDLLVELQGGKQLKKKTAVDRLTDTALSNYISSVFGFNPSIVAKQVMSAPLAGTYLGWENVPNVAAALKTSDELINTYTSELAYRLQGYATPETAQLKNNPSVLSENKVLKNLFGGGAITAVDGATVKTLWRWSENAVRKDNPNLDVGTQAQIDAGQSPFYQEVARRFEEAVSRSQPMYDVMHRSDAMRSEGAAVRALTMFKTVPMQQYNMLVQTANEAKAAKTAYDAGTMSKAEYVQSKRKAGRAVTGVILAGLGIEAMNLLFALWKNRGKKYRDEDGELTWQSAGMEFLKGFAGDNLGMIVGGDLLYDVAGSLITGDKWYGIETPGITQVEDVLEEIISAGKTMEKLVQDGFDVVKNGGDLGAYLKRNQGDYLGALNDAMDTAAAYLGGIPAGNLRTYILGAVSWAFPEAKTAYEDAMATADKTGLKGLTGDALEVRMGDILKNRLGEADEGTVAALAGLYEAGYTGAAPSDTPSSITVNGESHTLTAYQKQLYDMVWKDVVSSQLDELVQSEAFQAATPESQEKQLKKLYSYGQDRAKAELFDDYEGSSTVGKLMDAGLDQKDALGAALTIDGLEPLEGKSTVSDAQKAQAVAGLGMDEQQTDAAVGAILSESAMSDYEAARAAGLDPETYLSWKLQIAWYESKDTTGDGKKDLTRQAQVVESIDALDITKKQKDALYLTEYTEAKLGQTPWH